MPRLKLITKEIEAKLPPLYSTEDVPLAEKVLVVKWFSPWSRWTWYACEGRREENGDMLFFGFVEGLEKEWGYFRLSELASVHGPIPGVPGVERDKYWHPCPFGQLSS